MSGDPLEWLGDALRGLDERHLRRRLATRRSPQRPDAILLDSNSPDSIPLDVAGPGLPTAPESPPSHRLEQLVNFSANDYLGLAADPRLAEAAIEAARETGWGSGASPLITGRGEQHERLERALLRLERTPAVLLFPSGYAANVGAITSLVGPGDVILSDAMNHASIIDGCRLSGAEVRIYRHRDVAHAAELLAGAARRRTLIVTDSLFSMDGDIAPLADLAELARRHSAMLLVDEAHATGVFGERGAGLCEALGVEDGVHVRVGTLSKALGSVGGFVVGAAPLVEWLVNRARTQFFSTALPGPVAAASCAAVELVEREPWRRCELLSRAAALRATLTQQGWPLAPEAGAPHNLVSQIIPLRVGAAETALALSTRLREQGLLIPAIRPPSVPPGGSLLRISLSWGHSPEQLRQLVEATTGGR